MSNNKAPSEYLFDLSGNLPPTGTTPGSPPYNKTIYDLEKIVFISLNDFNKKYSDYIKSDKTNQTEINNLYQILKNNITAFDRALININSSSDSTIKSNELINNYKNIIDKRNDLDVKMMEINQTLDSNYIEYKGQNDSTKYTNILITVIATSLIYYIFVKL